MKRAVLAVFVAAALLACFTVQAQDAWPQKPVRLIVPYAAGGNSDDIMRPVVQKLGPALGTTVIIENRGGGGTVIGTDLVAKAPPDGYTLLYVPAPFVANPSMMRKLAYDSLHDFAPITQVMTSPLVLIVTPQLPARSVSQLIAYAKANPGKLSFGSGIGGAGHLAGELMKSMAGIDMMHIGYKGSAPAMLDLIAGRLQLIFSPPSEAIPQMRGGKVRALAVTTLKRSSLLPDLPTVDESGLKGFDVSVWGGLAAPAGTPRSIINKVQTAVAAILKEPDIREHFKTIGAEPVGSTPEEFDRFLREQIPFWARIIKQANIHIE